jgi:hypothetical protein
MESRTLSLLVGLCVGFYALALPAADERAAPNVEQSNAVRLGNRQRDTFSFAHPDRANLSPVARGKPGKAASLVVVLSKEVNRLEFYNLKEVTLVGTSQVERRGLRKC